MKKRRNATRLDRRRTALIGMSAAFLLSLGLLPAASMAAGSADCTQHQSKLQQLWDAHQIQSLMSRHEWYYSAGEHQRELDELFARHQPDVSFGTNVGYWVGLPSIEKFYVDWFKIQAEKDLKALHRRHPEIKDVPANLLSGTSMMHTLTTPLIVVAADGKTAKGMWYAIGQVTQTPLGQPTANYMWERYAIDFIKEDGHWKIWHFNVYTDVAASPNGDWTKPQSAPRIIVKPGEVLPWNDPDTPKPDVPGTFYKNYNIHNIRSEKPKIPVPYCTFSDTFSYGPPKFTAANRKVAHVLANGLHYEPPESHASNH